jgi:hypothetical protein
VPPTNEQLRAALDRAIKAEQLVDLVHDQEEDSRDHPLIANEVTAIIEQECQDAVSAEHYARQYLVALISQLAGPAPWTVLIAGHLVCLTERADCLTVIPVEKIRRLDDLRRFP